MMTRGALVVAGAIAWSGIAAAIISGSREPTTASAFDERFGQNVSEAAPLKKQDRLVVAEAGPVPVKTEVVLVQPQTTVEAKPVERKRREVVERTVEQNICTRHRLKKVWVTSRRWRCRK